MLILLILFSVALAATAQLALKRHEPGERRALARLLLPERRLAAPSQQPFVWGGLFLFGLSALVWLVVLSRASLSFPTRSPRSPC